MDETIVRLGEVLICAETVGDPADPAILLIGGAAASMDWWHADFCGRLAAGGRYVVRYDHRDTGRSETYPPGEPGYRAADLESDAVGLVSALAGGRAHLVGISMGGGLAQSIGVRRPSAVASLTLIATSPISRRRSTEPLPPMAAHVAAAFARPAAEPDWTDREAVIDHFLAQEELYAGEGFDPGQTREIAERVFERSRNLASAGNHWLVIGEDDGGSPDLAGLTAPALVVHGDADPLFPAAHGRALAAEIPGAELLPVKGMGHQVPPRSTWDKVVPAILRRTA
ncbi:alpha/beta fold hydrolase [Hamadaea tsunoensis]|uniref:alpha/beta fold hydrolase n=1 Tax=Hamadaea tsunoensis TaxID=53368 RepID=UPI0004204563|nr:alpha/beta hydrolase [Hamadaea tsunoensis]